MAQWAYALFDGEDEGCAADPTLVLTLMGLESFSGRVTHADGSPAGGCRLFIERRSPNAWPTESGIADADADGAFCVRGLDPDDTFFVETPPAPGRDGPRGWALARPGERDVRIVLRGNDAPPAACELLVYVVDPAGRAVPRFEASIHGDSDMVTDHTPAPGTLRCPAVRGHCWVTLWGARDARGQPLSLGPILVGPLDPATGPHTVVLPPEAVCAGRILDEQGIGVAGVGLRAFPWRTNSHEPVEKTAFSTAVSAEDGSFRLGGLPQGKIRVFLAPPDGQAHHDPIVAIGGMEGIEVALARAVTATLRVVSEEGLPLAGIPVSACAPLGDEPLDVRVGHSPGLVAFAWTGPDGVARLDGLDRSRSYGLHVNWGSRHPRRDFLGHLDENWIPIDGTIRLRQEYAISGRALDWEGSPLPGALVRVTHEGGSWRLVSAGDDGAFGTSAWPRGMCRVEVWQPGDDALTPARVTLSVPAGTEGVTLRLPAPR